MIIGEIYVPYELVSHSGLRIDAFVPVDVSNISRWMTSSRAWTHHHTANYESQDDLI